MNRWIAAWAGAGVRRSLIGLLWLGASCMAHAGIQPCRDNIDTASPVLSSGFAFGPLNTRNQPSAIHSGNVARLRPALTHVAAGATGKRGAVAVTRQTVYFSEGNEVVACNRETGCEYWRARITPRMVFFKDVNFVRSSAIVYLPPRDGQRALVFAGDTVGRVYAFDASNGAVAWARLVATDSRHMITGSFQVHDGVLFVPLATVEVATTLTDFLGTCCKSHGTLQAVNAYTGEIVWTYETAPPATYHRETGSYAPSGMSLWGVPMIDAARGQVLIGTGQNLSRPTTGNSDAIVALDIRTGKERWVFQATANDAYNVACEAPVGLDGHCDKPVGPDFDFGAPPVLALLPSGKEAVIAGGKDGVVYSLEPATGRLNWRTKIGAGGSLGGIHWGLAIDDRQVYAAVTDLNGDKLQLVDVVRILTGATPRPRMSVGAQPGIYALDLETGGVIWKRQFKHDFEGAAYDSIHSAALSVSNDVVFAASLDGIVRALRTSDGADLWSFDTAIKVVDVDGDAGQGGTIDSVGAIPAGSELFVNSGYNNFGDRSPWQAGYGNALFIFRLANTAP